LHTERLNKALCCLVSCYLDTPLYLLKKVKNNAFESRH